MKTVKFKTNYLTSGGVLTKKGETKDVTDQHAKRLEKKEIALTIETKEEKKASNRETK